MTDEVTPNDPLEGTLSPSDYLLIQHHNELAMIGETLSVLVARLDDVQTRAARVAPGVVSMLSLAFRTIANEVGLSDNARERLEERLTRAARVAGEMIDAPTVIPEVSE